MDRQKIFGDIYRRNGWSGRESRSGTGSDMEETTNVRTHLPQILEQLDARSLLDIPCGDVHWLRQVHFSSLDVHTGYIGADIVPQIISDNQAKWPGVDFRVIDLTRDALPVVDVILCRDLFGHLSQESCGRAVDNIMRSGAKYFIGTHWPTADNKKQIDEGQWRPINMDLLFKGKPVQGLLFLPENWPGKELKVWQLNQSSKRK